MVSLAPGPLRLIFGLREASVKIGGSAFVSSNSENISCVAFLKHKNSRKQGMQKKATKSNKTQSKWCINKHGASKIIDTFETYHLSLETSMLGCSKSSPPRTSS
jgi:hypothetical protein